MLNKQENALLLIIIRPLSILSVDLRDGLLSQTIETWNLLYYLVMYYLEQILLLSCFLSLPIYEIEIIIVILCD